MGSQCSCLHGQSFQTYYFIAGALASVILWVIFKDATIANVYALQNVGVCPRADTTEQRVIEV